MTDVLPDLSILNGVGVVGLCVFAFVAFTRGWLVAGPIHKQAVDSKDTEIRYLKEAAAVKDEQLRELREVGRTVDAVLQSITDMASRGQS